MAKDIATDNSDNAKAIQENIAKGDYKAVAKSAVDLASVGGTSSVFREPSQSGLDPVTELLATLTGSSTANAASTPFYNAPETNATREDDTNNQGQAEHNHRHSEPNENTHNQAEKDRSGSVKGEKQAEELQINEKLTPQTDAWQYRQQGQYQDTQAEQHAAEQGKNEHSGSLKDNQQAEQSQTESVGDKYPKFDKLLGRHEGGYDDFNAKNGSKYTAHRGEEIADGKKLSDLTVGEVMQMQKNGELFAAGHYQITPLAMKDAVRLAGVSPDEQFSSEIQDKLFEDGLLKKAGAGKLHDYITGKSDDIDKAMLATAQEWAAFPVPHDMHISDKFGERDLKAGDSYYEGVKGNHSNMSLEDAKAAIEEMRTNYLAAHSENNQTESTAKSAENLTVESVNQSDNQVSGSLKDNGQPEKHSQNNQTTQTADNVIKSATPISGQSENTTETVKVADTQTNRLKDNWEYKKGYDNSSDKPANSVEKTPNRFLRRISYREIEGRKFDCSNPVEREESFKSSPFCSELRSAAKKMIDDKALYTGERSYENAAKYILQRFHLVRMQNHYIFSLFCCNMFI